jgi:hypothetical protein
VNNGLRTFNSIDFAVSHKPRTMRCELQAMNYELQIKIYEIQDINWPVLADDIKVQGKVK